jgi:hypothetical protein
VKLNQRFDYGRLAEVLQERGMVDPTILRELLSLAQSSGGGFAESLVLTGHVSDWDLSRVVCEIFQLPFLPVGVLDPDPHAADGLNREFLMQHGLVPIGRFGQVLTISMPAMVPAEVLGMLAAESDLVVLPVVGSVQSNRAWVEEHFATEEEKKAGQEGAWSGIFDEADAAVLLDLQKVQTKDPEEPDLEFSIEASLTETVPEAELAGLEFPDQEAASDDATDLDAPGMGATTNVDLPPSPSFSE